MNSPKASTKNRMENETDPRHHPLMIELDRMYRRYNDGLPLPNAHRVAASLSRFLAANPKWPLDALKRAIWNRYYSVGVNYSEDPALFLHRLVNYAADPLDQWGHAIRGKGREVERIWKRNEEG